MEKVIYKSNDIKTNIGVTDIKGCIDELNNDKNKLIKEISIIKKLNKRNNWAHIKTRRK